MFELGAFEIFVIGLMIAIGIAFVVVLVRFFVVASRQRAVARAAGLDTVEAQAAALRGLTDNLGMTSASPTRPHSIEARLAELTSLHNRGVISDDEYATARRRALEVPDQA